MRLLASLALLVACGAPPAAAPSSAPLPSSRVARPPRPGPATHVVALGPRTPTAILRGPFLVTAINPGSDLELGLSPTDDCAAVAHWFAYSGGGTAAADGELLCARSHADHTVVHGFSGHSR